MYQPGFFVVRRKIDGWKEGLMRKILRIKWRLALQMLIMEQHKSVEKTGPHQIGLLAFGLFALLISVASGVYAAAERRV